jgi:hypothetical protein
VRGEDAVIEHQVDRRARRDRGECLQQFDGFEGARRGAIAPDRLQRDEDAPVGSELDAVLGERGAEERAAERCETGAIGGGDPDAGVELDAGALGLAGPAGADVVQRRLVGDAPDASAGAGPRAMRPGTETLDPCITQQAHLSYNADAHAQSVKAVKAFLAESFKLN